VVDRVGDGGGYSGQTDLSEAAGAVGAHEGVGDVEEVDIDVGSVGDGGDDVVGEVGVDGSAVAGVVDGLLEEGHADSHDGGTGALVGGGAAVDDAASVDDGDDAADAEVGDAWVPLDFGELDAEGVHGVLFGVGVAGGLAFAAGAGDVGGVKDVAEGGARGRGLGLGVDAAVSEGEGAGVLAVEGRVGSVDGDG